jgi:hypothetical protein
MSASASRGRRFAGRIRRGGLARLRALTSRLPLPERTNGGIATALIKAKRQELVKKRTFGPSDLDTLKQLLDRADAVVPLRACIDPGRPRPSHLIGLRHDTDHEIEGAVRLARWEAEHGYRSTWFVLHGDWYWGGPAATSPSRFVLRALDRIAGLGHEIGLHNNAVTLSLQTGADPHRILDRDLAALRNHGFDIVGSVRHGDPLCRRLDYLNSELFSECPRPGSDTTSRMLEYDDARSGLHGRLLLEGRPMAEFGLTYEANFIGHDLYQTDTGGHWGAPFTQIADRFAADGGFLQILVHPVWWATAGEVVRPPIAAT